MGKHVYLCARVYKKPSKKRSKIMGNLTSAARALANGSKAGARKMGQAKSAAKTRAARKNWKLAMQSLGTGKR